MNMIEALAAEGRAPEIPAEADVYGWLVGSWDLHVVYYLADVRHHDIRGEAHFGWVLEGRAVQDVWIMKRPEIVNTYGTTIRIWDPRLDAWRVIWMNPISGKRDELIGRRVGNDVIQIGAHGDGTLIRWRFLDVTSDSFRWVGEALEPDGETWKLEAEFHARRRV
jgi:hypothetical protein